MRLKDNHMQNGQLKPAYNWQISTSNQYVTYYSIHQTTTDTTLLEEHLQGFQTQYQQMPDSITADAGYGSAENYDFLADNQIESFIKYNMFHHEQTDKFKAQINKVDNLYYNQEQNCFYCPIGQKILPIGSFIKKTDNNYPQVITQYQTQNCQGFPLSGACHKQQGNRVIEVNLNLRLHKEKVRIKLHSEQSIKHRKPRPADVEATFGQIKSNHHFKRLRLKGIDKVDVEVELACIAQNLRKKACKNAKTRNNKDNSARNESQKPKSTHLLKINQQYPKIYSLAA